MIMCTLFCCFKSRLHFRTRITLVDIYYLQNKDRSTRLHEVFPETHLPNDRYPRNQVFVQHTHMRHVQLYFSRSTGDWPVHGDIFGLLDAPIPEELLDSAVQIFVFGDSGNRGCVLSGILITKYTIYKIYHIITKYTIHCFPCFVSFSLLIFQFFVPFRRPFSEQEFRFLCPSHVV